MSRTRIWKLGLGVCLLAYKPAVAIENWTVTDLGSSRTEHLCINAASEAFLAFHNVFGIRRMLRTNWTVYAYDLNREDHDAVVTCTFANANSTRATLIVYSQDSVSGSMIARRVEQLFEEQNARLEDDWLKRAYERNGF